MVVKERGLLNMGFGPVLFLLLLGGVMGVFFYSLTNISKRSAMKDERLIHKNNAIYKKGTQLSSFFVTHAIKRGIPVLLHQKKVYMRKGVMTNMNKYSLFDFP